MILRYGINFDECRKKLTFDGWKPRISKEKLIKNVSKKSILSKRKDYYPDNNAKEEVRL